MKYLLQGDVLLERVDDAPASAPEPGKLVPPHADGAVVLAEGETTGHRHAFYGGATLFRDDALARDVPSNLYLGHVLVAPGGALLRHEEHATLDVPAGLWRVRAQREHDAGEVRRVQD